MRKGSRGPKSEARSPKQKVKAQKLAIVALGANLGNAQNNILRAMEALQEFSDSPILRSSLWRSHPVDCPPDSPMFVNAAMGLVPRPDETPESLLARLKDLEKTFGRQTKKILNEPRPLDLDLIVFGNETRATKELTLPHPRARGRRFVLQPLSEIAPGLVLPGESKSVAQLLEELPPDEATRKILS